MKHLQRTVKAIIRPGEESGFVGECVEIAVVTQGRTVDETIRNLQEAVALHLEGESAADFGLAERPTLIVTMEIDRRMPKPS
jgi:predicted RNase H-like HicB family nuclease